MFISISQSVNEIGGIYRNRSKFHHFFVPDDFALSDSRYLPCESCILRNTQTPQFLD